MLRLLAGFQVLPPLGQPGGRLGGPVAGAGRRAGRAPHPHRGLPGPAADRDLPGGQFRRPRRVQPLGGAARRRSLPGSGPGPVCHAAGVAGDAAAMGSDRPTAGAPRRRGDRAGLEQARGGPPGGELGAPHRHRRGGRGPRPGRPATRGVRHRDRRRGLGDELARHGDGAGHRRGGSGIAAAQVSVVAFRPAAGPSLAGPRRRTPRPRSSAPSCPRSPARGGVPRRPARRRDSSGDPNRSRPGRRCR